ncbi:hypothetical protein [Faecalibacter sp. LW9]|uniref:hypothetical protein n=1 Tax=Faecalibacter sp. LW9 TaxID=3103144 RepID=UPI002AFE613B|nr:hypothetical protein [Faecalibacter sp. LW9]
MKKLTEKEIQKLFDFTKKHYVEYYDLQLELVDHLACGIEEQWNIDNSITFDDALNMEFKKFGVFGFSDIVDQRKLELQKKYKKVINNAIVDHLKKKEYVGLMLLFSIIYFLFTLLDAEITFIVAVVLFYSIGIYQLVRLNNQYKLKTKELGTKLVLVETIYKNFISISAASAFFNLGIQSILHLNVNFLYVNIGVAIILPFLYLILYVSCYYLPKHSDEILKDLCQEYQLIMK